MRNSIQASIHKAVNAEPHAMAVSKSGDHPEICDAQQP